MAPSDGVFSFIESQTEDYPVLLENIRNEAEAEGVPVIRRTSASVLKTLLYAKKPLRILEIGTGTGFSALFIAHNCPAGCRITTVENYTPRIIAAKENFKKAVSEGFAKPGQITLLETDAAEALKNLPDKYDFVFLDGAKGQYIKLLPDILKLMERDAYLLADNVLKGGDISRSRFVTERRQRTVHVRMREFIYEIMHCKELVSCILPVEDGMSFSLKI